MAENIINEVSVEAKNTLKGNVSILDVIHGKSAYEIAVINGFVGTEEEWLESIKGETGESGVYLGSGDMPENCNVQIDPNGETLTLEELIMDIVSRINKISTVTLPSSGWVGDASPYYQVVNIEGATANSKIDLNPTIEQLSIFHEKDITFTTTNVGGVITVYCIGQKPANDYTIQVSMTEVKKYG